MYSPFRDTRHLRIKLCLGSRVTRDYHIGRGILEKQQQEGWGAKVVERLSRDLRIEFPDNKGFSRSNLLYMRLLAEAYLDETIVPQAVGLIPWGHNRIILDKVKEPHQREWYVHKTIEHGWNRDTLIHYIQAGLYEHQGKAITNFKNTLPKPESDVAQQVTKDEYSFDFLGVADDVEERKLERSLVDNISAFILELGKGFAFMGSQYHIEVAGKDYYLDLLFYHVRLHCYVVIELKTTEFKPEYAGKMNFYLTAVDRLLRRPPKDEPSIGLILCKENCAVTVEYALHGMTQPMGVAKYEITHRLPAPLQDELPTAAELTARLRSALTLSEQPDPAPKPKTRKQRK